MLHNRSIRITCVLAGIGLACCACNSMPIPSEASIAAGSPSVVASVYVPPGTPSTPPTAASSPSALNPALAAGGSTPVPQPATPLSTEASATAADQIIASTTLTDTITTALEQHFTAELKLQSRCVYRVMDHETRPTEEIQYIALFCQAADRSATDFAVVHLGNADGNLLITDLVLPRGGGTVYNQEIVRLFPEKLHQGIFDRSYTQGLAAALAAQPDAWTQARTQLPANIPVYKPTWLPAGFGPPVLEEARTDAEYSAVYTVIYPGSDENIAFIHGMGKGAWGNSPPPETHTPVTINGANGTLWTSSETHYLGVSWHQQDGNYEIKVFSKQMPKDELLQIAQSLKPVAAAQ